MDDNKCQGIVKGRRCKSHLKAGTLWCWRGQHGPNQQAIARPYQHQQAVVSAARPEQAGIDMRENTAGREYQDADLERDNALAWQRHLNDTYIETRAALLSGQLWDKDINDGLYAIASDPHAPAIFYKDDLEPGTSPTEHVSKILGWKYVEENPPVADNRGFDILTRICRDVEKTYANVKAVTKMICDDLVDLDIEHKFTSEIAEMRTPGQDMHNVALYAAANVFQIIIQFVNVDYNRRGEFWNKNKTKFIYPRSRRNNNSKPFKSVYIIYCGGKYTYHGHT